MPPLQLLPDIYVPTFAMKVGGRPLEDVIAKRMIQVSVTESMDPPNHFSFQLYDPELHLINTTDGRFTEGQEVEISLGYVGHVNKMITGRIATLTADFPSSGPPTLQVDGFDALHRLTRGTALRKYDGPTPDSGPLDSQTVMDIARQVGLSASVDATPSRTMPRVQYHTTSLAFLEELARVNGYALWVEDDTLYFKRQRPAPNTIMLEWGKTLLSFSPRLSTSGLVRAVEVRGWDPMRKQSFIGRAPRSPAEPGQLAPTGRQDVRQGSGGRSEIIIDNAPVSNKQEAETLADAILAHLLQTTTTGSGTCAGHPDMRVGTILDIQGTGRFDASYTVTHVTHTVSDSGYYTSFQVNSGTSLSGFLSPPDPLLASPAGGRGRAQMYGIIVGLVIDNNDRQGLGRVKIKFPGASDDEIGHWARVATLMAGAGSGTFFLPEVHDEVLVAFEHGDITRPYVLGALWNGRDKPPDTNANGQNNLRLIKSRSGHLVRLDDTSGAEKIEIIDKSGKHSFTIDTANNTITITSGKDVVIEAPQGKIRLQAQNVEITSTATTKVEAQTTIDLQAKTTLTIKGQTVNIN